MKKKQMTLDSHVKYRRRSVAVLFVNEFNASSATKEQLITIFNQSGIYVLFLANIMEGISSVKEKLLEESEKLRKQREIIDKRLTEIESELKLIGLPNN